ncbi:MAG TPA: TonB-dependent receptor [Candidatus Acidoferrales bacterium]|nr:TonB-dependent receptor [Candidatus Acidoferrales bacterium]
MRPRSLAAIGYWSGVGGLTFALFLLAAFPARAQLGTGSIRGLVTDPSGAAIPGARVIATNLATSISIDLTTDSTGRYSAPSLPIGQYDVRVEMQGFKTAERQNITLSVGQIQEVDITLAVGQVSQQVTVSASVAQVNTTTATVSGLINQTQMRELPLNGRNFEQLIALTPGVVPVTNAATGAYIGRSQVYSFAGSRPVGQEEMIDGQDIQDFWDRGSGAAVLGTSLGVDSIAEFQTYTSTASAQFGGANGGVNAVTRSGANNWHGSAYEFARNTVFDASPFFLPSTGKPAFSRNQFGGTVGGPIKKNRAFFFVNYEGLRQTLGESPIVFLPNSAALTEASNYLATLTPGSSAYKNEQTVVNSLKAIPAPIPSAIDLGNGTSQEILGGNQTGNENYLVVRADYKPTSRDSLWARTIYDRATLFEPFGGGNSLGLYHQNAFDHNQFWALGWTRNISNSVINQAQFNFTRTYQVGNVNPSFPAFNCNPENGYDCSFNAPGVSLVFGLLTPIAPIFDYVQNKFEPRDQIFWIKGNHSISAGAWLDRAQTSTNTPVNPGGNYYFSSWGYSKTGTPTGNSFLTGQPYAFIGALPGKANSNRVFREIDVTGYIQDDWKLRPNLTVNLGFRYDFESNPVEIHNTLFAFVHPLQSIDTGYTNVPHPFITNPSLHNFDPRIGIAWAPFKDYRTAVRAGFGIVHDPYQPRSYGVGYNFSPPFDQVTVPFPAFTVPIVFQCIASPSQCTPPLPSIHDALGYNITTTPYVIQYSLTVERQIPGGIILSVGYLGSQGSHLLAQVELNPPINSGTAANPVFATQQVVNGSTTLVTNPRIDPNLGDMGEIMPWAHASYNAFQVQANRSMSHGLLFQTNYTFSHCLANSSATYSVDNGGFLARLFPYPMSATRGNCSFDRKNNASFNSVYDLPFRGNRLKEGWQVSNILQINTGLPFTVFCGFDCVGLSEQNSPSLPNVVPGTKLGSVVTGNINHYFNTADFTLPTPGTIGNEAPFQFYGPSLVNDDFSLSKSTRIRESMAIQLRAEIFNILNHPNFNNPNSGLFNGPNTRNPTAGRILSTISASGGLPSSRQIQFALKFIF